MNSQYLQNRLEEIQRHINSFKERLAGSENHYQTSLKLITNPRLRSSLMEQHVIHTERQKTAITKMEGLYSQVRDQLASLNNSDL
jgi:regulator of replication initiation timing